MFLKWGDHEFEEHLFGISVFDSIEFWVSNFFHSANVFGT